MPKSVARHIDVRALITGKSATSRDRDILHAMMQAADLINTNAKLLKSICSSTSTLYIYVSNEEAKRRHCMFNLNELRHRASRLARRHWMWRQQKEISNNDNYNGLERLYRISDPWDLDSALEHARFKATNELIRDAFGSLDEILEVGCGEGFQSRYLKNICRTLYGIDVSPTAVERAKEHLPDAHFHVGPLTDYRHWLDQERRFDLVTACEVLYYIRDVKQTVDLMNCLGKACFVSFFAPEACKLASLIDSIPGVRKSWFTHDNITWLFAWWHTTPSSSQS